MPDTQTGGLTALSERFAETYCSACAKSQGQKRTLQLSPWERVVIPCSRSRYRLLRNKAATGRGTHRVDWQRVGKKSESNHGAVVRKACATKVAWCCRSLVHTAADYGEKVPQFFMRCRASMPLPSSTGTDNGGNGARIGDFGNEWIEDNQKVGPDGGDMYPIIGSRS